MDAHTLASNMLLEPEIYKLEAMEFKPSDIDSGLFIMTSGSYLR